MQALVSELWRLEGSRRRNHIGDLAWQRFQHTGREPRMAHPHLGGGRRCPAWAWLRLPASFSARSIRAHRSGSLHRELIAWFEAEAECTELRTSVALRPMPSPPHGSCTDTAIRLDPSCRRVICHLIRTSTTFLLPALPRGYRLRTVEPDDVEQRVAIHRTVWAPSRVTSESFAAPSRVAVPRRPRLRGGGA